MISFDSAFSTSFGFVGGAIIGVAVIAVIAAWVILASSRFIQGGIVERAERVPQLYGYTVCLVALFWAVTSVFTIVEKALTLGNPVYQSTSGFNGMEPSVSSFEAFRTTYEQSRRFMMPDPRSAQPDSLSETELRRRYEAIRADRIQRNTVDARRSLITSTLSLLVAAALFIWHWRWLQRVAGASPLGGTMRIDI